MSIRRDLRWLVWAMAGLMTPLPLVHAQAVRARTVAESVPASFWVKQPVRSTAGDSRKAGAKNSHDLDANVNAPASFHGAKKNDSIASELAGSKSVPWSIVVGLTLLTLLPALLLSMTPLVRLLVVFHFLRQALGTQTAPSNQVLMGLALDDDVVSDAAGAAGGGTDGGCSV